MTKKTRVLIAGAGPVGTVAAYRLAQMGIDVILIEPHSHCPEDMRASTLHPPSLDMLEELGVLDELIADGLKAPVYQYRNRRSGSVIALDSLGSVGALGVDKRALGLHLDFRRLGVFASFGFGSCIAHFPFMKL